MSFQRRDGLGEKVNGTALTGLCSVAQVGFAPYQGDGAADAGLTRCVGLIGESQVGPLEAE